MNSKTNSNPSLGQQLRAIRLEKDLTQVELANICNVPQHTISDIENGNVGVTVQTLLKVFHGLERTFKIVPLPLEDTTPNTPTTTPDQTCPDTHDPAIQEDLQPTTCETTDPVQAERPKTCERVMLEMAKRASDELAELWEAFRAEFTKLRELITHLVIFESNRIIAAKAPKRKRKFGSEGNGLKGPRTRTMLEQLDTFERFLLQHPVRGKGESRQTRAKQCWLAHHEWEKARTAQGESKGYSSHKALAAAKTSP